MFSKTVHIQSEEDLTVTLKLPEEFLEKDVTISVLPVSEEVQRTDEEFFAWLRSRGLKTKGWKFNRDEANEQ